MRIGYVTLEERGATDRLLADLARGLLAEGVAVAGAVQNNVDCGVDCEMDVQVLPDGPVIRISQRLGAGSSGCRLDAGALETAVAEVAGRMQGARLLIINKFGKHESEGRGFRQMVADAVADGLPVLIGVNATNLGAFRAFAGDLAEPVPPEAVARWLSQVLVEGGQ
ncbi:MAG: 3-dehydroquinate dehydratase [Rhodobacterales bacterium 65-51]|uniref:DUF2478 domain-containing protein n=1 Tax=uncultured Gemmobacter sp. TaxID=1095917 RepID=UPI000966BFD5|nr:DUF2478 domain-containing protein [uncultured Gemmobacter sp.]OJY27250.1 MAG: 3-dehydroquinate dehydratase [Rhodobacterales bacterium 65-51]